MVVPYRPRPCRIFTVVTLLLVLVVMGLATDHDCAPNARQSRAQRHRWSRWNTYVLPQDRSRHCFGAPWGWLAGGASNWPRTNVVYKGRRKIPLIHQDNWTHLVVIDLSSVENNYNQTSDNPKSHRNYIRRRLLYHTIDHDQPYTLVDSAIQELTGLELIKVHVISAFETTLLWFQP